MALFWFWVTWRSCVNPIWTEEVRERGVWFRSPPDFLLLFFVFVPPSLHFVTFHKISFTFGQNLARWYLVFVLSYWPELKPFFWKNCNFWSNRYQLKNLKESENLIFLTWRCKCLYFQKIIRFWKKELT